MEDDDAGLQVKDLLLERGEVEHGVTAEVLTRQQTLMLIYLHQNNLCVERCSLFTLRNNTLQTFACRFGIFV